MEPESAVTGEPSFAWVLWCGLPIAALLLFLARFPLWLTMPIPIKSGALVWTLVATLVASLALRPATTLRAVGLRFAASATVLTLAWGVGDDSVFSLVHDGAATLALLVTLGLLARWKSASLLAVRALLIVAIVYRFVA